MPGIEIVLSNKLRKPAILKEIEEKVLDGRDAFMVAKKNGWAHENEADGIQKLIDSCVRASGKRVEKGEECSVSINEQTRKLDPAIRVLIPHLTSKKEDNERWGNCIKSTDYEAIKFLYAITSEIYGKADRAILLWNALYPIDNGTNLLGHQSYG